MTKARFGLIVPGGQDITYLCVLAWVEWRRALQITIMSLDEFCSSLFYLRGKDRQTDLAWCSASSKSLQQLGLSWAGLSQRQEPDHSGHHLWPPKLHTGRKLASGAELGPNPGPTQGPGVGFPISSLTTWPHVIVITAPKSWHRWQYV